MSGERNGPAKATRRPPTRSSRRCCGGQRRISSATVRARIVGTRSSLRTSAVTKSVSRHEGPSTSLLPHASVGERVGGPEWRAATTLRSRCCARGRAPGPRAGWTWRGQPLEHGIAEDNDKAAYAGAQRYRKGAQNTDQRCRNAAQPVDRAAPRRRVRTKRPRLSTDAEPVDTCTLFAHAGIAHPVPLILAAAQPLPLINDCCGAAATIHERGRSTAKRRPVAAACHAVYREPGGVPIPPNLRPRAAPVPRLARVCRAGRAQQRPCGRGPGVAGSGRCGRAWGSPPAMGSGQWGTVRRTAELAMPLPGRRSYNTGYPVQRCCAVPAQE